MRRVGVRAQAVITAGDAGFSYSHAQEPARTLESMETDFEKRAEKCHRKMPGLLRALLEDFGISSEVVDRYSLGWDGQLITIPVRTSLGSIAFFETWDTDNIGVPVDEVDAIELFGWDVLLPQPDRIVIAEGIHEALVLQSQDVPAVSASGSGRYFKRREWVSRLQDIPEVVIAFKRGEHAERGRWCLNRADVIARIRRSIPHARTVSWPKELGKDGGVLSFLAARRPSRQELEHPLFRV